MSFVNFTVNTFFLYKSLVVVILTSSSEWNSKGLYATADFNFFSIGENQHVIFNILFLVVVTFRGIERSLKGQLLFWIWEVGFCNKWRENLNQIRHVHGHLIDSCVVEFFNVVQSAFVFVSDKVNGDSLTAETSTSTNSVKKKKKIKITLWKQCKTNFLSR